MSGDVRGELHQTAGSKRPLSDAGGSLRASKAAKVINEKVVMKQLQKKSRIVGRKIPPIISGSPMMNMMARKRAQSHARSPNSQPRSPNSVGTLKSPSLLGLSPAPTSTHDVSPIAPTHGIMCKHRPKLDVSTRWNSTFLMLESTLPFRKAFETLGEQEPNYTFTPSAKEWEMAEDICQLLKVFCRASNVISGSNYPTSNLYFLEIWSIKMVLEEQSKSENATIKIMVKEMQKKFDKYFKESYLTNCIPVILDPRFKMDHVEFRLKKYFGVDVDKHMKEVKEAMEVLFTQYAAKFQDNDDVLSQDGNSEHMVLADSVLSDWDEHVKLKKAKSCNELQRYLEEDFHPRTADFDILKWWAVNSARYPILGTIARDVLAVPASTVASESAFSTGGRVITDYRSSLAPETIEALMCFENWIRSSQSSTLEL